MIARYQNQIINKIWSDENKYKLWQELELVYLKTLLDEEHNISIVTASMRPQNIPFIKQLEQKTKHELVAFLLELNGRFNCINSEYAQKYLHWGLTSSDIIDTAFSIQIKESIDYINLYLIHPLIAKLQELIVSTDNIKAVGRTHGKHAEEISFSSRFDQFLKELLFAQKELIDSKECLKGKFSGPVGTSSFVNPVVVDKVLERLNLEKLNIASQIIPRHFYIKPMYALLLLMLSLERFSTIVRLSAIDEVNEMQEGFSKGQTGSSAMPHKNNPVISENIAGLSRIVKANFQVAVNNTNLWWERDISHSSAERIIWPDTFNIVAHALTKMKDLLDNLNINEVVIQENLHYSNSTSHQELLQKSQSSTRFKAYDVVKIKTNPWSNKK